MSDTSPLTAGGFAPPPTDPDTPTPDDDNWLLQDFLQARALAQQLGITARLDAFAAAHGTEDEAPPADAAIPAAAPPNGGVIARWGSDEDHRAFGLPLSAPPPVASAASGVVPPEKSDTASQDPPLAAPASSFRHFTPEPEFAAHDGDTTPFALKVLRLGESLAPATLDTPRLGPSGQVLQGNEGTGAPLGIASQNGVVLASAASAASEPGGSAQPLADATAESSANPGVLSRVGPQGGSPPPPQLAQSETEETRGGRAEQTGAFYDAFITARYGATFNNLRQLQADNYALSAPSLRAGPPTSAEVSELDFAYRIAVQTQPLANRATEVLRSLNDPRAEDYRTVAVLRTTDGTFVAGSGARGLDPPQRNILMEGETPVRTQRLHAEINALTFATGRPLYIGTSRDFCPQCVEQITRAGGIITSPRTAYFPMNVSLP